MKGTRAPEEGDGVKVGGEGIVLKRRKAVPKTPPKARNCFARERCRFRWGYRFLSFSYAR